MILAGEVDGIFSADPLLHPEAERIPSITPATASAVMSGLGASHGVDVTGGMAAKVGHVLDLLAAHPGLEVVICSGLQPGNVARALLAQGHAVGTRLWNPG